MKLTRKMIVLCPPIRTGKQAVLKYLINPCTQYPRYRLGSTQARLIKFPDLREFKFFIHKNGLGGWTVTEKRTGLAVRKSEHPSEELCLSEAKAMLERGAWTFKGLKGLKKHILSLPSKFETVERQKAPLKLKRT